MAAPPEAQHNTVLSGSTRDPGSETYVPTGCRAMAADAVQISLRLDRRSRGLAPRPPRTRLLQSGEHCGHERHPLRAHVTIRGIVVPLVERMGPAAATTAIHRDRGETEADENVGVGARCARRRTQAEGTAGSDRGSDDERAVG